ncbi:MAG: hypothetical protein H7A20_04810 [Rhodanobacteraceae bacterium]|nr:hypothetical protein [Rhodanobacteraceae bacterium]
MPAIDAFFDGFEEVITPIRFWVPADEKQALGNPLRDAIERRNSLSEKSLSNDPAHPPAWESHA